MKHIGFLLLASLVLIPGLQAQSKKDKPEMAFDKTVDGITAHDFGSIVLGANGTVDFHFRNDGTKPLVITDVKSSCGCTVPSWPKEPIAAGKTGTITLKYDTNLPGAFNKTVAVYSNANNSPVRLEIRGKVNARAEDVQNARQAGAVADDGGASLMQVNEPPFATREDKIKKSNLSEEQKAALLQENKKQLEQIAAGEKAKQAAAETTTKSTGNPVKK